MFAINTFSGMRNPQDRELSDPSWRRFFDILKAKGVTGLADNQVGAARGMWSQTQPMPSTVFDPGVQQGLGTLETNTNQLNARPSMQGLQRTAKRKR